MRRLCVELYIAFLVVFVAKSTMAQSSSTDHNERKLPGVSMSADVFIYLFDQKTCEQSVLPAYERFVTKYDTSLLLDLVRGVIPQLDSIPDGQGVSFRSRQVYEEYIEILSGKQRYGASGSQSRGTSARDMRVFVENSVAPSLIQALCLPHDMEVKPEQSMSRPALLNFLYSQSRWIEDYFTFAKEPSGAVPIIKIGEWNRFFSREEVEEFDIELARLERPSDDQVLADGFDNLRALVHAAVVNPHFTILFSIE